MRKSIDRAAQPADLNRRSHRTPYDISLPPTCGSDYEIRRLKDLFGHADAKTTMIYNHVLNREGRRVKSVGRLNTRIPGPEFRKDSPVADFDGAKHKQGQEDPLGDDSKKEET